MQFCEMFLHALLVVIVTIVITLLIKWYSLIWKLRHIPGPPPLPLIGNLSLFLTSKEPFRKVLQRFTLEMCDQFEDKGLAVTFVGPKPIVNILKPKFVSEILRDTNIINKGDSYNFMDPWLGKGLITINGKEWKAKRKLLNPTFHSQILEDYIPAINEQIDKFIEILNECTKEDVDIRPLFTNLTLDIISATSMGVSLDIQGTANKEYLKCMNDVLLLFMKRVFSSYQRSQFIYNLTSEGKKCNELCATLRKYTFGILKKKKEEVCDGIEFNTRKKSFMDVLLEQQKMDPSITDDDIRQDVDTFMFAGHDTSAVCLKWSLLLIGNHPNVQTKIQEELNSIFGDDSKRQVNKDDLSKMNYIECVIKEALRMYPPVPIIAKKIDKEICLNGYTIPKGMNLFIHLHKSHRHSSVYENPNEFIPERFMNMSSNTIQMAFVPFSAGLRNCIGQRFAMIEMKLILSQIFRNFSIKAISRVEDVESVFEVIYKPISEIRINFQKLNS